MLISQPNNHNDSAADSLFLDTNQDNAASKRTSPSPSSDQIFKDMDFQKIEVVPSHQLGKFPIGVESYQEKEEDKKRD